MATTVSIPKDHAAFKKKIQGHLAGLEKWNPSEITEEVIARLILGAGKNKVEGPVIVAHTLEATFYPNLSLTIKPLSGSSAGIAFNGTCVDPWDGTYTGTFTYISEKPGAVRFDATDGISVAGTSSENLIIITFYNEAQSTYVATFVASSSRGTSLNGNSGTGQFRAA